MSYTWQQLVAMQRANPDLQLVPDAGGNATRALQSHAPIWTEHDLQAAVIAECDRRGETDGRWRAIFAIPNGGARDKATAGKLKAEGVRAGVPDLFCAVPSGLWHGLFIELKIKPNRPRTNQMEWMQRLRQRGYRCVVCYDTVGSVIEAIAEYLEDECSN